MEIAGPVLYPHAVLAARAIMWTARRAVDKTTVANRAVDSVQCLTLTVLTVSMRPKSFADGGSVDKLTVRHRAKLALLAVLAF